MIAITTIFNPKSKCPRHLPFTLSKQLAYDSKVFYIFRDGLVYHLRRKIPGGAVGLNSQTWNLVNISL